MMNDNSDKRKLKKPKKKSKDVKKKDTKKKKKTVKRVKKPSNGNVIVNVSLPKGGGSRGGARRQTVPRVNDSSFTNATQARISDILRQQFKQPPRQIQLPVSAPVKSIATQVTPDTFQRQEPPSSSRNPQYSNPPTPGTPSFNSLRSFKTNTSSTLSSASLNPPSQYGTPRSSTPRQMEIRRPAPVEIPGGSLIMNREKGLPWKMPMEPKAIYTDRPPARTPIADPERLKEIYESKPPTGSEMEEFMTLGQSFLRDPGSS